MGQTDLAAEKKGRNKEEKVTEKQQRIEKRVNQERRRQIYILVFPDSNAFPCRSANIIKSRPQWSSIVKHQHSFSSGCRNNLPLVDLMFYFGCKFGPQSTDPTSSCILLECHFRSYLVCPGDIMQQIISSGTVFKWDWQPFFEYLAFVIAVTWF